MSLDEAIEIHEHLGGLVEGRGLLFFSWVIPAFVVVGALGLAFSRFLARLEPIDRRRFVLAGALYVGGVAAAAEAAARSSRSTIWAR